MMNAPAYRFEFAQGASLREATMTLQVAMFAAEGLFGPTRVCLDFNFFVDEPRSAIYVDATTAAGELIIRLFMGLILREFGESLFRVYRVGVNPPAGREITAA